MRLTGENFLGFSRSAKGKETFRAFAPAQGAELETDFHRATSEEFEQAVQLVHEAFPAFAATTAEARAGFLDAIANAIMGLGDALIERCVAETGLPAARITGERARTCMQLKLFASLLRDGWWVDARIETAIPDRQPLPKPDIRRMLVPLGPVAVYGASNFPLAFSTAGGDTASALAAGCPVVVKAHSSHPGTNELVASAVVTAAKEAGMPEGVFSSLYLSHADSVRLVEHPHIKAVGFTGSRKVGMILFNAAISRPEPIPVYAEMSAINPVFLFEQALRTRSEKIAKDLVASVTLGVGQFCTNPGLVILRNGEATDKFLEQFKAELENAEPGVMLNQGICKAYYDSAESLAGQPGVKVLLRAKKDADPDRTEGRPMAFVAEASEFLRNQVLSAEVFGPATTFILCNDDAEREAVIGSLEGQLTATIHAAKEDEPALKPVLDAIVEKAGRVIFDGFPTGVEVCHAMQHGGPFPSTTDGRSTSVGTAAIYRFLRPVAYQGFPDHLLPDALKNANPLGILRLRNGEWTRDAIS